jgi:hypothetical protein
MRIRRLLWAGGALAGMAVASHAFAQVPAAPLPDIHQLMRAVEDHQKKVDTMRENYTYTSFQTRQEIDAGGQVKKTETEEREEFFVNGHPIRRVVKRDGKPLTGAEEQKESQRVTKLVEKAQKVPRGEPLDTPAVTVGRLLEIMDLRNPRREMYRGRATVVLDFIGRKDAKTHGIAEDASKKLQGTLWIDEADLQVAHVEVSFDDNFRVAGGLLASIEKGSSLHFDQSPVNGGLWMPTGAEVSMQARVMLFKNLRERITERNYDFKSFHVDAQGSEGKPGAVGKP